MKCKEAIRQLSEYLDQELTPELARRLEEHLALCEDCRLVVNTCQKTIEVYCNTEPLPLPDEVRVRLDRALAEKIKKRS